MYSLSRVGGLNKTFCVNHRRTAAELRICRLSASNLNFDGRKWSFHFTNFMGAVIQREKT